MRGASLSHLLKLLTGPEDIGRSRWFWAVFIAVCVFLFVYPFWLSEFEATNNAYYLLNVPIALGLALLWGYCGILSFGQVAYFGVAGYVYGIVAGNMIGNAAGPIVGSLCGLAMCALTAAIFGYFVFYGPVAELDRADSYARSLIVVRNFSGDRLRVTNGALGLFKSAATTA